VSKISDSFARLAALCFCVVLFSFHLFFFLILVCFLCHFWSWSCPIFVIPSCAIWLFLATGTVAGACIFEPGLSPLVYCLQAWTHWRACSTCFWHCIRYFVLRPFLHSLVMGSVGEFTVLIWVGYTGPPFGVLGIYFELAPASNPGSLRGLSKHCECNKKDCSVHILGFYILVL
jgi:hypothetical protein